MKLSELIKQLQCIMDKEGDLEVVYEADPYGYTNLWAYTPERIEIRDNPEHVSFVKRYRNPKYKYKGKLVYLM